MHLNEHEKNYSAIKNELLAVVWGVKYFRPYLYGKEFDIHTDHQPLKWLQIKSSARDINPRLQRWLIQLGEYDAKIDYIKGKENKKADFLSRIDVDLNEIRNIQQLDTVVNGFKTQIILAENKENDFETVLENFRIFIEQADLNKNIVNILSRSTIKGKVGIYIFAAKRLYIL